MTEIVSLRLDNDMDLILAHKRCMKIAELCGLPVSSQTRFSTAVSEIARCAIANGKKSVLHLGVRVIKASQKEIVAIISNEINLEGLNPEAFAYAKRISGNVNHRQEGSKYITELNQEISTPGLVTDAKIKGFNDYFKHEPPLSPYDEIRKKNIELLALSEKLGESENKYRQLTDTLPLLIFTVNANNRVELSNKWMDGYVNAKLTVCDKTSLSGLIHADDVDLMLQGLVAAKTSKSGFKEEVRVRHNGEYFWHAVTILPDRKEGSTVAERLIVMLSDIDAQKRIADALRDNVELKEIKTELEKTNKELFVKNRELDQFAFVASHDLQEPLRKIMIMISRATESLTPEEKSLHYLDRISAAAQRMSNLIRDILHYSRLQNIAKGFVDVNLNVIVKDAIDDLEMIIAEKQAEVTFDDFPIINGVESQLRQMFFNLINNALKFNDGQPKIAIRVKDVADVVTENGTKLMGAYHLITVADNGIGIKPEQFHKVFEMFQRLHQADDYGGNGIGLSLCRRVVENHHGLITVTSAAGEGTTFNIYLPVRTQEFELSVN